MVRRTGERSSSHDDDDNSVQHRGRSINDQQQQQQHRQQIEHQQPQQQKGSHYPDRHHHQRKQDNGKPKDDIENHDNNNNNKYDDGLLVLFRLQEQVLHYDDVQQQQQQQQQHQQLEQQQQHVTTRRELMISSLVGSSTKTESTSTTTTTNNFILTHHILPFLHWKYDLMKNVRFVCRGWSAAIKKTPIETLYLDSYHTACHLKQIRQYFPYIKSIHYDYTASTTTTSDNGGGSSSSSNMHWNRPPPSSSKFVLRDDLITWWNAYEEEEDDIITWWDGEEEEEDDDNDGGDGDQQEVEGDDGVDRDVAANTTNTTERSDKSQFWNNTLTKVDIRYSKLQHSLPSIIIPNSITLHTIYLEQNEQLVWDLSLFEQVHFPNLQHLICKYHSKLTGSIDCLVSVSTSLQTLILTGCHSITGNFTSIDRTTHSFNGRTMKQLKVLNIEYCDLIEGNINDLNPNLDYISMKSLSVGTNHYGPPSSNQIYYINEASSFMKLRSKLELRFPNIYKNCPSMGLTKESPEYYTIEDAMMIGMNGNDENNTAIAGRGRRSTTINMLLPNKLKRPPLQLQFVWIDSQLGWRWGTSSYNQCDIYEWLYTSPITATASSSSGGGDVSGSSSSAAATAPSGSSSSRKDGRSLGPSFQRLFSGFKDPPTKQEYYDIIIKTSS